MSSSGLLVSASNQGEPQVNNSTNFLSQYFKNFICCIVYTYRAYCDLTSALLSADAADIINLLFLRGHCVILIKRLHFDRTNP